MLEPLIDFGKLPPRTSSSSVAKSSQRCVPDFSMAVLDDSAAASVSSGEWTFAIVSGAWRQRAGCRGL